MPFFEPAKFFVHLDCVSLQVHKPFKYKKENNRKLYCKRKRVCLLASRGSITVEAAIVTTIFMMVIIFIESFIIMINTEMSMQIEINNVTKSAAKKMFGLQTVDEITDYNQNSANLKNIIKEKLGENEEVEESFGQSIDVGYLMAELLRNIKTDAVSSSYFLGGVMGINASKSSIENGNVDMVVAYQMRMPFTNQYFEIKQRSMMKDWTGCDITENPTIVYITKSGEVYHRAKECKYLVFDIIQTTYGQIEILRNNNGGKYKQCSYCGGKDLSKTSKVYITSNGDKYHTGLECQGLTRNVISIDISRIEGRRPCSSCGQGE